jgi:hypothetical protein
VGPNDEVCADTPLVHRSTHGLRGLASPVIPRGLLGRCDTPLKSGCYLILKREERAEPSDEDLKEIDARAWDLKQLLARSWVKYGDRGRAEIRKIISVLQETEALVHLFLSILDAWGRPVGVWPSVASAQVL